VLFEPAAELSSKPNIGDVFCSAVSSEVPVHSSESVLEVFGELS
jgi:hypothetical protein